MGRWRCAGCGNRICLEAAIRTSRARSHPRNFVSAPVAGPTATRRRCARFCRMGAPRARGAARAGRCLVPWDTGTECACLRARRWQSEAVPARCHSGVHSVWGRKKGRCTHTCNFCTYVYHWRSHLRPLLPPSHFSLLLCVDRRLTSIGEICILSAPIPCPRSASPAGYILTNHRRICGFDTRPSYSHRADRPHRTGGRVLETSDIPERRCRMVHGAIRLSRARVPPYCVLIWRPLPSAEAANPLPNAMSSLPPHTHRTLHIALLCPVRLPVRQA